MSVRRLTTGRLLIAAHLLSSCTSAQFTSVGKSFHSLSDPIATSIDDALPANDILAVALRETQPETVGTLELSHGGYYRVTLETYCLHAGTYAPTHGEGYLLAPLTGTRAEIIKSILRKARQYRQVDQRDIQALIWSIEAEQSWQNLPPDLQGRVSPLLSPHDILDLTLTFQLRDALTDPLRTQYQSVVSSMNQVRQQLGDLQATYEQIASVAVLHGDPPPDPSGREIPSGLWTAIGDGTYVRVFPQSYMLTDVELLRYPMFTVERDERGRITRFADESGTITTHYDDRPGKTSLSLSNGRSLKVWQTSSIIYRDNASGALKRIAGTAIILQPSEVVAETAVGTGGDIAFAGVDPRFAASLLRLRQIQQKQPRLSNIDDNGETPSSVNRPCGIGTNLDLLHYFEGLKTALPPDSNTDSQIRSEIAHIVAAWAYAGVGSKVTNNSLGCSPLGPWQALDLSGIVAVPGNTNSQRLGLSDRAAAQERL